MKKKILFLIAVVFLIVLFTGCDKEEVKEAENGEVGSEQVAENGEEQSKEETKTEEKSALDELYEILTESNNVAKKEEIIALLSGKSAYEVAVENGFSGTEKEWLDSLHSKDGDGPGKYSLWLVGEGRPTSAEKNVLYLDAKNGIVYYYDEDEWIKLVDFSQKSPTVCIVTLCYSEQNKVEKEVVKGECLELPIPEKTGKVFLGWFTGSGVNDAQITSYSPIVKDMVLYPKFDEVKYKITYIIGEESFAEQEYFYDETIVPPTAEEREDIVAWKDIPSKMPAKNIAVYAVLEGKFVVRFMDGENVMKVQYVREGDDADAPAPPIKEGYDFDGWEGSYVSVSADTDVFTRYAIKEFTVTFLSEDDKVLKEEKVEYQKSATAPSPEEKVGFEFVGWSAEFSCVTSDLTIKAQYRERENSGENEGEEVAPTFIIIEDDLYFNTETPEKVVLDGDYTSDMLCTVILDDVKLRQEGYAFQIENELISFSLENFTEEGECFVPIKMIYDGAIIDCFVEVVLVA